MSEETEKGEGRIWAPESYEQARQILERLFPAKNKIVNRSDSYEMAPGAWKSTYKEFQRFVKGDPNDRIYVLREKEITRCSCPCSYYEEKESLTYMEEDRYEKGSIWHGTGLIKGITVREILTSRGISPFYIGSGDRVPYSKEEGWHGRANHENVEKKNWSLIPEAQEIWKQLQSEK